MPHCNNCDNTQVRSRIDTLTPTLLCLKFTNKKCDLQVTWSKMQYIHMHDIADTYTRLSSYLALLKTDELL